MTKNNPENGLQFGKYARGPMDLMGDLTVQEMRAIVDRNALARSWEGSDLAEEAERRAEADLPDVAIEQHTETMLSRLSPGVVGEAVVVSPQDSTKKPRRSFKPWKHDVNVRNGLHAAAILDYFLQEPE